MCKWKSTYLTGYECKEPPLPEDVDKDGYCILHSEDENKDIGAFREKVCGSIATTGNRIDLIGCYFPGGFKADFFQKGRVKKPVDFREATFTKGADFIGATFKEGDFVDTSFEKGVLFDQAEFKERVRFEVVERDERKVFFGPGSSFQYTRFPGEVVFQGVDLSNCSFLHSSIDRVDFRYCEFAEANGRKNVIRDELGADKKVEESLNKSGTRSFPFTSFRVRMTREEKKLRGEKYEPVRRLYLELKRNFEDKKDWNMAGDFHYGEMECRRKKYGWLGRNILSLEAPYYWASGYGERPLRAFIVLALLVLVAFPLLLSLDVLVPPLLSEASFCFWNWVEDLKNSVGDSLEVAAFTRVTRIGEAIKVAGWDKCVLVSESIFVYVQILLFALALRRKVKR